MDRTDTPLVQLLTEATRDRDRIAGEMAELASRQRSLKAEHKAAVKRIEDLLGDLVEPRPLLDMAESKTAEVVEERPDGGRDDISPEAKLIAAAQAVACPACGVHAGQACKRKPKSDAPHGIHGNRYSIARHNRTSVDAGLRGDQLDTSLLVASWGGNWKSVGLLAIFPRDTDADPGTPEGDWIDRIHEALSLPSEEEPTIGQLFAWLEGRSVVALPGLTHGDRIALQEAVGNFCLFVPEAQDVLRGEWFDTPEFEPDIPPAAPDIPPAAPDTHAWRSAPLTEVIIDAPWPNRGEFELASGAMRALAQPAGTAPGITTLGQLIDVINGENGSIGGPIEDMVITRPDGEPGVDGFFTDAEVKALRFALHSRREVDKEFARDVEAWEIDPTLRRLLFKVELKPCKQGDPKRVVYLRANSKLLATEYAQDHWRDAVAGTWEINADKPPEGVTVMDVPLDSYEDRLAAHRLEKRAEEHEQQEAMARAMAEKEPELPLFAIKPGKGKPTSVFIRAATLGEAVGLAKTLKLTRSPEKVNPWYDAVPAGSAVFENKNAVAAKEGA